MKTLITLCFSVLCIGSNAQTISSVRPAIETHASFQQQGFSFELLPKRQFVYASAGMQWGNYGDSVLEFIKSKDGRSEQQINVARGRSMVYNLTIGASVLNGSAFDDSHFELIPYGFVNFSANSASGGGGIKLMRDMTDLTFLHLYLGAYGEYTFSDFRKFFDAGISISYFFGE